MAQSRTSCGLAGAAHLGAEEEADTMKRRDATATVLTVLAISLIWGMVLWQYTRPEPPQSGLDPGTAATLPTGKRPTSKIPAEATPPPEVRPMATTIVSITAYLTDADLSDNQASAGVYDPDGNLLGVTIQKGAGEMSGGGEWVTFDFASPLDVSAHEQVRLAVFGNFEEVGYAAPGPDVSFDTSAVYTGIGSWPAHVDPPEEFGWFEENKVFSIYATGGTEARIGTESSSETGFYMEGEKVCATGLLDTAPLVNGDVAITVIERLVLTDEAPGEGDIDIGITVEEQLTISDGYTRASRCWGRYADDPAQAGGTYVETDQEDADAGRYIEG